MEYITLILCIISLMIRAINIKKEFGNIVLFEGVSFHVKNGEKIALIGRNGTGKTTLFRLITKEESLTQGDIVFEDEKIGYLTQEFDFPKDMLLGEYIEQMSSRDKDPWKVVKILSKLGLDVDEYQEVSTLSGGEKMRLKLAELLYNDATTLLLDEPTNHLDIDGIQWMKRFISSFKGSVMLISHDRDLLNSVVDRVFEIDEGKILQFDGNYDEYLQKKGRWLEVRELEYNRFVERKKKLEVMLKKARMGIIRSRTGSATEAVKKRIEREIVKRKVDEYDRKEYSEFTIDGATHSSKLILRVSNVSKSFGEKEVLKDISFEMRGKEKVWLFGKNGEGKTTLLRMILGEESIDSGTIQVGENVNVGYFEQKQRPLDIDTKLIDYYSLKTNVTYYNIPKVLGRYLFSSDDLSKQIKTLSPGQQARLKFALFAEESSLTPYQLLILDEPAQHLDIETKEVVERAINDFQGAVILVSHDVYSVGKININRGIEIRDGFLCK